MPPLRVCFVCAGNICRSPTAEVVMRQRLDRAGLAERVVVDSAGTGAWHVGRGADPRALRTLRRHGYRGDDHRARQFDPAWFADRDLVVAMDDDNARALRRMAPSGQRDKIVMLRSFDPASGEDLEVPDPYYSGSDGFDDVLALVEAGCDGLIDELRTRMLRHPEPALLAELSAHWEIEIGTSFEPGGKCGWVATARRRDGEDVVVKIAWPHPEGEHEADGLRLWDGDGCVRLLDVTTVEATPVMLLERCLPGTHLAELASPDEQDVVVAQLLRRLWREPPAGHGFRPLQQMCEMWSDEAEARLETAMVPDHGVIRAGLELFCSLPATADREVVLFTDLHAENILAAHREPWLAIDPKPYVGDPAYDALQHMLNVPRLHSDPDGLTRRMADLLDLDPDRLRLWLFARCAVHAVDDARLCRLTTRLAP